MMLYVLGIVAGLQIVIAQSLWKVGLERMHFAVSKDFIESGGIAKLLTSPFIVGGALIYIMATLTYFAIISKYVYSGAQTVVVSSSLIFTFASAIIIFNEHLRPIHFLGIVCLMAGVLLITRS